MAQFLGSPFLQLNDASGVPLSGGKLYVYEAGTTTPLALFSDNGLTTPAANPVVASAAGVFATVFIAELEYKAIVLDADDNPTGISGDDLVSIGFASDVPASAVSFDGTASGLASENVQDAIDEISDLMGGAQDWATTSDGVIATATSTNAGAAAGPEFDFYRDSASPANSDALGALRFSGRNASAVKTIFAKVQTVITDTTNGSEDGELQILTKTNGSDGTATKFSGGKVDAPSGFYSGGVKWGLKSATSQATTSGTAFDFTDIPAGVTKLTVVFSGVSLSGSDSLLVQLGTSGGMETSSYVSSSGLIVDGSDGAAASSTNGFVVLVASSGEAVSGAMTIFNPTGNVWTESVSGTRGGPAISGGGTKTLSGTLTQVRVTRSGSNTFDAGSVNLFYE